MCLGERQAPRRSNANAATLGLLASAGVGLLGRVLPTAFAGLPATSTSSSLRGSAPVQTAGAGQSEPQMQTGMTSCSAVASLAGVAALATAAQRRRSAMPTGASSIKTSNVTRAARGGEEEPWFPRLSCWTTADLAAEKTRVLSEVEGPGADYTGPRYESPASVTKDFIDQLIAMQEKGGILPKRDLMLMVIDIIEILGAEKTVGKVTIPSGSHLTVVGDLHGQYWDFMNLLKMTGHPSAETPFVFNGDFVDRGSWSIEVISVLLAFKLKDPSHVFMNRGNHEMLETNVLYGFCGEVAAKYGTDVFDLFSEAFRRLPLAHLADEKVLILHAGIPGPDPRIWIPGQTHDPTDAIPMTPATLPSLKDLENVERDLELSPDDYVGSLGPVTGDKDANDRRAIIDFLWGDPRGGDGYGPSYRRGKGVYMYGPDVSNKFCEANNLQCIVRSHEVKALGSRWDHPKVLTVFSAPNYLDTGNNKGAFLKLTKGDGAVNIEATSFEAVPHPDLAPMHWQEHITNNYPHLLRKMKKKEIADFDEFGDSDFSGFMNITEWEEEEAKAFTAAYRLDDYGREIPQAEAETA
eukprot:TRINITY_DN1468_c0_g1_i1.p1 TRINITY_DN1468_c0_g1~~TRINITY_DN1468_c0_g1_i1.p1  ORF type:complete len:579 (-),score=134.64 TRINITY_DN1468_c0_g1_i1:305-2041(-)